LDGIGEFQACVFRESCVVIVQDSFLPKMKFMPQESIRDYTNL